MRRRCGCHSARTSTCSRSLALDAPHDLHWARAWLPVVAMAWCQPKREGFSLLDHAALWLGKDITLLVDHDQRRTPGLGKVIIALLQVQPKGQPPRMPLMPETLL